MNEVLSLDFEEWPLNGLVGYENAMVNQDRYSHIMPIPAAIPASSFTESRWPPVVVV